MHAAPDSAIHAEYDRVFAAPIVFGSDRNGWLMDEAFLAFRQPPSESYAAHALRQHADALLSRLAVSHTTRGQVERILTPMLRSGVRIECVAAELGVSRQTLLRRLKAEGTTFEQTVDELRRTFALTCLTSRRLPVKQVARETGYSDVTAFSRAFKRWTGRSPRAYVSAPSQA
jgi:AraC-like DNA-binding protein